MRNFDENYSLVRVLHAIPDTEAMDVYLNGDIMFKNMNFTEFSPYIYVPEGEYILELYPSELSQNPILEKEIKFESGKLSTLALIGSRESIEILNIDEDMVMPPEDKSKLRFIHLVPNGREVNVLLDGEEVANKVRYKDVTEYEVIDPEIYQAEVELSQNGKLIRSLRIRINPNRIYSFYALGNKPNFQVFQSLDGATFLN